MNIRKTFLNIDLFFAVLAAFYYILPAVSAKIGFQLTFVFGVVYLLAISFKNGNKVKKEIVRYVLLFAFIAVLYLLLTDISTISEVSSNRILKRFLSKFYQMYMMFLPVLFLKRMMAEKNAQNRKLILFISYALFIYVMVTTIRQLSVNANIMRAWKQFSETSLSNIANYYFVYAVPYTALLSYFLYNRVHNGALKGALLAAILYQLYFLLVSQYTISVIICALGFAYEFIRENLGKKYYSLAVIAVLLLLLGSPWIIRFAAKHVPSAQMADRLNEVYAFLTSGDASGYNLNSRLTLYAKSIMAFIKSPLWGNRSLGFDGHSTFITIFSDLGLLGGIPYIYLYGSTRRKVKALLGEGDAYFQPHFFMLVLMGLVNPIHAALPLMFACWFVVPLTICEFSSVAYVDKKADDYRQTGKDYQTREIALTRK